MRVLYVAMADDYGVPGRGASFEQTNFHSALVGMGHDVVQFDFMARKREVGTGAMRRELVSAAAESEADVAFFCLFTDELDVATLEEVRRVAGCPTVNWFADDHWRFETFTRHIAGAFDLAVTTDEDAIPKYRSEGLRNAFLSQWAFNRYGYRPTEPTQSYGVTFIGQPHASRPATIERIRAAGHAVECWGEGWPRGRIEHEEMVRVFSSSKVNLNLANSSAPENTLRVRLARLAGRGPEERPAQIKGRNFEVPGCGGFLLTERVPHLDRYYNLDEEVGVYEDEDDLIRQIDRWVADDAARAAVAEAGYRRTMAEHTYDHRFQAIFEAVGVAG